MIRVDALEKQFRTKQALAGVSLDVPCGVTGLLGPNGAGKTTLLRCILGILEPTAGRVTVLRSTESGEPMIGYLPQHFGLLKELTVFEALSYFATLKKLPRERVASEIAVCLDRVSMSASANTRVGRLSGGMTRRVGVATALLGDPPVLIFDEPTAGLDPEERVRFKRVVSELADEHAILISTHIVGDIEALADHVAILVDGTTRASGTLEQITELARGKCFVAPKDRTNEHSDEYYVDRYVEVDGQTLARIMAPRRHDGFSDAAPTLEDGYLAVTRGLA